MNTYTAVSKQAFPVCEADLLTIRQTSGVRCYDAVGLLVGYQSLCTLISLLGALAELRQPTVSFVMTARPHGTARLGPTGRICVKFGVLSFF